MVRTARTASALACPPDGLLRMARQAGLLERRGAPLPAGHPAARRRLRERLARRALRATTPASTSLPRRSRQPGDAAARCCWPTSTSRSPSTDESFDGVVLKDVLEHVVDPVAPRPRDAPRAAPRRTRLRLLAGRAALGLGRLHPPPSVHPQGFRLLFEDQGFGVDEAGYESVMPVPGSCPAGPGASGVPPRSAERRGCRWCAATCGSSQHVRIADRSGRWASSQHDQLVGVAAVPQGHPISNHRQSSDAASAADRPFVRQAALRYGLTLVEHERGERGRRRRRQRLEAGPTTSRASDARVKRTRWRGGSRPSQSAPKRRSPRPSRFGVPIQSKAPGCMSS